MGDNTFHSVLSPSKRHRWGVCPGSIREEAKYPSPPSGPAALDGTRTHAILEYCINSKLIGPLHLIGNDFTYPNDDGTTDTFKVDKDRAERVNLAIEYIRDRVNATGSVAIAEKRVHPDGLVLRADMSGTVDCQIPGKDIYEIIDYKDGMGIVEAKDNPQLEIYALGVLAELPPEQHPKWVRMTIIQPKLAVKGMPPITSHDIKTADLLAKVPTIIAEAAACDDPNAPLVPGDKQCKFCPAKGGCTALASKAMQEVNLMFSAISDAPGTNGPEDMIGGRDPEVLTIPSEVMDPATQAAQQDPSVMTDAQLAQILEAAPLVRQLLKGAEEEIQRRLEAGKTVPGFKLVNGRGSRKWALPPEEMEKKLTGMGMPKSAIYVTELISPAQAEKVTWEKKGETVKLSDKQIERMKKEYITTMMGKPTVAPESDPRPAVVMNAAPMFSAVEPVSPIPSFLMAPVEPPVFIGNSFDAAVEAHTNPPPETSQTVMPDWLTIPSWLK